MAAPAAAQSVQRLDISGHVAPRCWSVAGAATNVVTNPAGQIRCNTAQPQLNLRVRPRMTQSIARPTIGATRSPLELVVTPVV